MSTSPQPPTTSTTTTTTTKQILVLSCSTRTPRLNPYITQFIISTITPLLNLSHPLTLLHIDLASPTHSLPLATSEPLIPAQLPIPPTAHYTQPHTRRWSTLISSAAGIIFVTPQYNWSIPGVLKNALDYLYHEWSGKPVMFVSYGGKRGGGKASEHLMQVAGGGLKMRVCKTRPMLSCDEDLIERCERRGEVDEKQVGVWSEGGKVEEIKRGWRELEVLVGEE